MKENQEQLHNDQLKQTETQQRQQRDVQNDEIVVIEQEQQKLVTLTPDPIKENRILGESQVSGLQKTFTTLLPKKQRTFLPNTDTKMKTQTSFMKIETPISGKDDSFEEYAEEIATPKRTQIVTAVEPLNTETLGSNLSQTSNQMKKSPTRIVESVDIPEDQRLEEQLVYYQSNGETIHSVKKDYLNSNLYIHLDSRLQSLMNAMMVVIHDKVCSQICNGSTISVEESTHVIMKNKHAKAAIEENMRRSRLKESKQHRKDLEDKLKLMNNNIEYLQGSQKSKKNKLPDDDKHLVLIRKMKRDKKDREVKQEKMREINNIKAKEEQMYNDEMKRQREEEKIREIQDKRVKILERMEKQKQDKLEKKKVWDNSKRSLSQDKPLFQQLEESYNKKYMIPELERRKMELKNLRLMRQPISNQELGEHAKRHEEVLKSKMQLRYQERIEKKNQENYDPSRFRTKLGEEVQHLDARDKEEKEFKDEVKRQLNEKKESYARYVREMHLPSTSSKKQMELEQQVCKLKHPVREKVNIPRSAGISQCDQIRHKQIRTVQSEGKYNEFKQGSNPRKKKHIASLGKPPINDQRQIHDYLKEMRMQKIDKSREEKEIRALTNWQSDMKNKKLTDKERYEKVKEKAERIEELASRKEQIINVRKGENNVDDTLEVNDMLIDAIKAKLSILENI